MAEHYCPLRAARPVPASPVLAFRKGGAVGLGPGENIVTVRRIAASIIDLTFFGQGGLLGEIVGSVQFGNVLGNGFAFCVDPGTLANSFARVYRASPP